MDKQKILLELKDDMKIIVDNMNLELDSVRKTEDRLKQYFDLMRQFINLPTLEKEVTPPKPMPTQNEVIKMLGGTPVESEEVDTSKVYEFDRKLKGGTLIGKNCFIPERIVREQGIEHGDLVRVKETGRDEMSGNTFYDFTVEEARNRPPSPDRIPIDYAVVEYDEFLKRYFVQEDMMGNTVRIDEVPQKLYIQDSDVTYYELEEGDIIDIAYSKKQSNYVRVVWKYPIESPEEFTRSSYSKQVKDKVKKEYEQTLVGQTVLMVGFEPGRKRMEEEVLARGGEFMWAHGKKEGETNLHNLVRKSTIVISMLEHMGHGGSKPTIRFAKELGIPHGEVHSFGRSTFINKVHEKLDIMSPTA